MKEILSFYEKKDKEEIKEILVGNPKGHVEQMLELTKNVYNSKYGRYVKHMGSNYDPKLVLSFAIMFHDAGKIFFQKDVTVRNYNYLSFKGHEFFSAYIFNELKKNVLTEDPENFLFNDFSCVIEFAIFYHHHAMNIVQRKEVFRELREEELRSKLEFLKYFFNEISNFPEVKENVSIKAIEKTISCIQNQVQSYDLTKFLRHEVEEQIEKPTWKELQMNAPKLKLSYLTLSALITLDSIAASKSRGEKENRQDAFLSAIHEFYKYYLQGT
ncbi:MAG: CRISPR-associated endonuclease Cas3'' [Thermoproteota archaeon]|jgi:CRISPR-associated endonuclease Cas3-HD